MLFLGYISLKLSDNKGVSLNDSADRHVSGQLQEQRKATAHKRSKELVNDNRKVTYH